MLILALDTSSAAGSVAIVRGGRVLIERAGDGARTHGERLPRELMDVLDEARVTIGEVDRFAVSIGPGSFTGLRIGIATMQGLALAQGKPIAPVSSFEALARTRGVTPASGVTSEPSGVGVWIDAHRGEVFAMLYDADGSVLHEPTSLTPEATLDAWSAALAARAVQFAGDGARRYRDVIAHRLGTAGIPAEVPALAGAIGLIAAADHARAVRPHAVAPLYVRRSDAELARDRRQPASRR